MSKKNRERRERAQQGKAPARKDPVTFNLSQIQRPDPLALAIMGGLIPGVSFATVEKRTLQSVVLDERDKIGAPPEPQTPEYLDEVVMFREVWEEDVQCWHAAVSSLQHKLRMVRQNVEETFSEHGMGSLSNEAKEAATLEIVRKSKAWIDIIGTALRTTGHVWAIFAPEDDENIPLYEDRTPAIEANYVRGKKISKMGRTSRGQIVPQTNEVTLRTIDFLNEIEGLNSKLMDFDGKSDFPQRTPDMKVVEAVGSAISWYGKFLTERMALEEEQDAKLAVMEKREAEYRGALKEVVLLAHKDWNGDPEGAEEAKREDGDKADIAKIEAKYAGARKNWEKDPKSKATADALENLCYTLNDLYTNGYLAGGGEPLSDDQVKKAKRVTAPLAATQLTKMDFKPGEALAEIENPKLRELVQAAYAAQNRLEELRVGTGELYEMTAAMRKVATTAKEYDPEFAVQTVVATESVRPVLAADSARVAGGSSNTQQTRSK